MFKCKAKQKNNGGRGSGGKKKKNERESASHHKGQTRKGHIWEYEKVNIFDVGKVT